jgi:hypothetical protein
MNKWLKGLIGGVIGGVANTIILMIADPITFNVNELPKLGKVGLISAILNAAFYLAKAPVPPTPKPRVARNKTPLPLPLILAGLFAFAAFGALVGCSTPGTSNPPAGETNSVDLVKLERTTNFVRVIARDAVSLVLRDHPSARQEFSIALIGLNTLLNEGTLDPQLVRETLAQIIKGDASDSSWMAITAALTAYEIYFGEAVARKLNTQEYILPVLRAFRDGLRQALEVPPPAES